MVANEVFQKAVDLINRSNNILITSHTRPDGDACGSVRAMCDSLESLGKKVNPVGREAMEALVAYDWPGNVRELKNVIERAMLLDADTDILLEHLPGEIYNGDTVQTGSDKAASVLTSFFPMTLREIEKIQIERTLEQTNGNKSKAANILGISRQTLREKLKQFEAAQKTE